MAKTAKHTKNTPEPLVVSDTCSLCEVMGTKEIVAQMIEQDNWPYEN